MPDNTDLVRIVGSLMDIVRPKDSKLAGDLANALGKIREYQRPADTITREVLLERGVSKDVVPYLLKLFQGVDLESIAGLVPERRYVRASNFRSGFMWNE